MDALFKTTTKNTLEEYKRFSKKLFYSTKNIVLHILMFVFLILAGIVCENQYFIIFAIIYPIILRLIYDYRVKKAFSSNKLLQNVEVNYEFYDTYFTQHNEVSDSKVEYEKLYKLIETKTNMYLMVAENQGFILAKTNFPDGLAEFLREKCKN